MRCHLTFLTGVAIACGLVGHAAAEPFQRYGAGVAMVGLDNDFGDESRRPGPALAIDLMGMPWDAPVAIGGHLGIGMGFNHQHDAQNFPMNADYRETMVQLGLLVEVHQGPVALGVGINLDSHHSRMTDRDDGNPAGAASDHRALGSMVQLAVDAVPTGRGTIAIVGSADRFGMPDILGLLSNGDAGGRYGTTFMLGLAFRPR